MSAQQISTNLEPLCADHPPAPPTTLAIWKGDTLVFSDDYRYEFQDRTLLNTALTCAVTIGNLRSNMLGYEHNQDLAMQGDNAARLIMQRIRLQRKQGTGELSSLFWSGRFTNTGLRRLERLARQRRSEQCLLGRNVRHERSHRVHALGSAKRGRAGT